MWYFLSFVSGVVATLLAEFFILWRCCKEDSMTDEGIY
jgi:hypothetical protein